LLILKYPEFKAAKLTSLIPTMHYLSCAHYRSIVQFLQEREIFFLKENHHSSFECHLIIMKNHTTGNHVISYFLICPV